MRPGTAAAVAACALAGCASGDGLLIEVVPGDDLDPSTVGAIDVWIGEPDPQLVDQFVRLPLADDLQTVKEWPFQILVVPDAEPRTVWAGAFGYRMDTVDASPVAVGTIDAPIDVVPGELRYARLVLHPYFGPDADCLFAPAGLDGPSRAIVPPGVDPRTLDCDDDLDPQDCDDLDPAIHHNAPELCDGVDNNCDQICDEGTDQDGDHFSRCDYDGCGAPACIDDSDPPAGLTGSCDCDDANPDAHPGGIEVTTVCDGVDNNCDGSTGTPTMPGDQPGNHLDDECDGVCDVDSDGDLIATGPIGDPVSPGTWAPTCDQVVQDCRDDDPEIYPNALEMCDGMDTDCNAETFAVEGPCFAGAPTGCSLGTRSCGEIAAGTWSLCTPGTVAMPDEVCAQYAPLAGAPWLEQAVYDGTFDDQRDTCTLDVWRRFDTAIGKRVNALCETRPKTRLHSPLAGAVGCTSRIAGGSRRAGYQLELQPRAGGNPGDVVSTCDIDLAVTAVDGLGAADVRLPSVWVMIIQQKPSAGADPAETVILPVEIRVRYADAVTAFACPEGRTFDCD